VPKTCTMSSAVSQGEKLPKSEDKTETLIQAKDRGSKATQMNESQPKWEMMDRETRKTKLNS